MALYIGGSSRQRGDIHIIANLNDISKLIGGEGTGVTERELKTLIKNINALGIANLAEKGVFVSKDATTYEIIQKIIDIKYEAENNSSIDEFGVVKAGFNIDENGIVFGDMSIDDNEIVNL